MKENEVKWEFIEGPLKGMEFWIVKPLDSGCTIVKLLEYEVVGFTDRMLWQIIHSWATLKQLKSIKNLAEMDYN